MPSIEKHKFPINFPIFQYPIIDFLMRKFSFDENNLEKHITEFLPRFLFPEIELSNSFLFREFEKNKEKKDTSSRCCLSYQQNDKFRIYNEFFFSFHFFFLECKFITLSSSSSLNSTSWTTTIQPSY